MNTDKPKRELAHVATVANPSVPFELLGRFAAKLAFSILSLSAQDLSPDLRRRIALMAGSSVIGILFFPFLVIDALDKGMVYLSLVEAVYLFLLVANLGHTRLFKRFETNITFGVAITGLMCMYLYISGGVENTGCLAYFLFPLVAIFLLGSQVGGMASLLILVPVIALSMVDIQHHEIADYSLDFQLRFLFSYLAVTGISFLFEHNAEVYRQEILTINEALESKVGERTADLVQLRDELHQEIGENKQAKTLLAESEERYRVMFEKSANGIFLFDVGDGRFLDANPAAEILTGRSKVALLQLGTSDVTSKADTNQFDILKQPGGVVKLSEIEFVQPGGTIRPVLLTAATLYDRVALGIAHDISALKESEAERKQLALQLQNSQKMEAIGTLAGGIAHDFNNILSAVIGYTDLSIIRLGDDHEIQGNLEQIKVASWRARELIQQILTFSSRKSDGLLKPLLMGELVEETMQLLQATLPATIRISKSLDYNCQVMGDTVQVNQLVMNLCTNASHAIGERSGELGVVLAVRSKRDMPLYKLSDGDGKERMVVLSVTDTGCGMPQDVINRVFDPFYTTKEVGSGTGMGLSVVHGIVKTMGGRIFVTSKVDQGSRFEIWLPAVTTEPEAEELELKELPKGNEHIVFVDDEPFIVTVGKEVLASLGYRVSGFEDPMEALEFILAWDDPADLVITDNIMPIMTGTDLAVKIQDQRPELPIIICSGKFTESDKEKITAVGVENLLMKPLIIDTLAVLVRDILDKQTQ